MPSRHRRYLGRGRPSFHAAGITRLCQDRGVSTCHGCSVAASALHASPSGSAFTGGHSTSSAGGELPHRPSSCRISARGESFLPEPRVSILSERCYRGSALPPLCSVVGVVASRVRLSRGRLSSGTSSRLLCSCLRAILLGASSGSPRVVSRSAATSLGSARRVRGRCSAELVSPR